MDVSVLFCNGMQCVTFCCLAGSAVSPAFDATTGNFFAMQEDSALTPGAPAATFSPLSASATPLTTTGTPRGPETPRSAPTLHSPIPDLSPQAIDADTAQDSPQVQACGEQAADDVELAQPGDTSQDEVDVPPLAAASSEPKLPLGGVASLGLPRKRASNNGSKSTNTDTKSPHRSRVHASAPAATRDTRARRPQLPTVSPEIAVGAPVATPASTASRASTGTPLDPPTASLTPLSPLPLGNSAKGNYADAMPPAFSPDTQPSPGQPAQGTPQDYVSTSPIKNVASATPLPLPQNAASPPSGTNESPMRDQWLAFARDAMDAVADTGREHSGDDEEQEGVEHVVALAQAVRDLQARTHFRDAACLHLLQTQGIRHLNRSDRCAASSCNNS